MIVGLRRREFVTAVLASAAWPKLIAARPGKAVIGVLALGTPDPVPFLAGLRRGMKDLGYTEGQDFQLEFRSAGGKAEKLAPLAAELVALRPEVIVAFQTPSATAAKQATKEIPIVIEAGDPVGTGLIESFARPGGNLTGISGVTAELGAKNLELMREMLPATRRVAVLANANDPFHTPFLHYIEAGAQAEKIEAKVVMVHSADELAPDFAAIADWHAQALLVQPSLPQKRIAELALQQRLPALAPSASFPREGGLMGYGADLDALYRRCAFFVDEILKGRKPSDVPAELPTKYWLGVNLKVAKALGIALPPTLLTRADELIE